jgi:hypothetical protein
MDQIFLDLINYARLEYVKHITSNGNAQYAAIINMSLDYKSKFNSFNASVAPSISQLAHLINPYFIGMGNPFCVDCGNPWSLAVANKVVQQIPNDIENSILIFGQELGFTPGLGSLQCFFEEQLSHHDLLLNPDSAFFNPYKANDFRQVKRHSHTWGVYAKFVAGLLNVNSRDYKKYLIVDPKSNVRVDRFEDHCFYSELYDSPSANHAHRPSISPERVSFFQSNEFRDFLSRFKYIIIGDGDFSRDYSNLLGKLFGITVTKPVQTLTDVNKVCQIIKNKNQHIAISNYPLSSQWKYSYIDNICRNLK